MTLPSVELGTVASVERKSVRPNEIGSHQNYVGLENITGDGTFVEVAPASEAGIKSNKFAFSSEHILYGKLRPYLSKIAAPQFGGVCSTDIVPIRPGPDIDRRFLLHVLRTPALVGHATRLAVGANLPRLSPKSLETFPIPLPPLEEQRRIAAVLDAADELRAKRREALAKLDTLAQAIFIDMFGDPARLPDTWPVSELQDLVAEGTSVTYGIVQAGDEFPGGVPYIRTGDIVNGRILTDGLRYTDPEIAARFERSKVRAGDLVMSIRATVGTVAPAPQELEGANLTQGTARIAPGERVDAVYLLKYLQSAGAQRWIARQVKGATFREITLGRLRELPVPVPPPSLQARFATRVAAVEEAVGSMTASSDALGRMFGSLQQRAFRGQL